MPELRNEVPTDEELHAYFMQHFAFTTTGHLFAEGGGVAGELHRTSAALVRVGCGDFIRRAGEAIFASLRRLNRLPRSDPFWHNTNNRPTVYKLPEFCSLLLNKNPQDVLALWTLLTFDIFWGSECFDSEHWKMLYAAGGCGTEVIVCAAIYRSLSYAGSESADFTRLLKELDMVEEARLLLNRFLKTEDTYLVEWVRKVLAQLDSPK